MTSDNELSSGRPKKRHRRAQSEPGLKKSSPTQSKRNASPKKGEDDANLALVISLYPHLSPNLLRELTETARHLATPGKGIVACDESAGTIGKRFEAVGVENTAENRRAYRQMLFETEGADNYLCGSILDPETLYQKSSSSGKTFPQVLSEKQIVPGVKPHLKVYTLPGTNGDTVMQGLDSLAVRAKEYYKAGARFAKWRSPITIDMATNRPTNLSIRANMHDLARYALICQSEGLMPIVEPDITLNGTHTLEEAVAINVKVQAELFKAMNDHNVYLAGATLKPNMVNPGKDCPKHYTVQQIAEANLFVLEQSMPVAMPGVNYLSGGQTLRQALARLNAINKAAKQRSGNASPVPWNLSFSWSAALQLPLLEMCKGQQGGEEVGGMPLEDMAKLYIEQLRMASLACRGEYDGGEKGDGDHPCVADDRQKK